jgi:hypothetical protein
MIAYTLEIELLSDTTFGMGAGVARRVDSEIRHDAKGLPTLSGRALKGLLVNECSEILYVLPKDKQEHWEKVALRLFGQRGEMLDDVAGVFIGDATVAPDLAEAIHADPRLSREEVIDSLTTIRHQTAMNEMGAPKDESLRAVRVLVKGLTLYSSLSFTREPDADEKALLAACVMSLRRAGLNRNRGKGQIRLRVTDRPLEARTFAQANEAIPDQASVWFKNFSEAVNS